jgi:hypothetical protein
VTTTTGVGRHERVYLVERYLSAAAAADLEAAVTRVARVCSASRGTGAVQYLHSTFVPADDTCFCAFQAGSSDAVRAVNRTARFGFDRISDAQTIQPADLVKRSTRRRKVQ